MIKLKQLLTEYSEHSFKMPKLQKKIYMGYFKKLMPKTARTEKKAEKRLNGKMYMYNIMKCNLKIQILKYLYTKVITIMQVL